VSDIVTQVIQRWSDTTISTHHGGCWEWHPHCAIAILADEIKRLTAEMHKQHDDAIHWLRAHDAERSLADQLAEAWPTTRPVVSSDDIRCNWHDVGMVEGDVGWSCPMCPKPHNAAAEIKRLRAEVERLRTAGDVLAEVADEWPELVEAWNEARRDR
jgi:hypothetical protein